MSTMATCQPPWSAPLALLAVGNIFRQVSHCSQTSDRHTTFPPSTLRAWCGHFAIRIPAVVTASHRPTVMAICSKCSPVRIMPCAARPIDAGKRNDLPTKAHLLFMADYAWLSFQMRVLRAASPSRRAFRARAFGAVLRQIRQAQLL